LPVFRPPFHSRLWNFSTLFVLFPHFSTPGLFLVWWNFVLETSVLHFLFRHGIALELQKDGTARKRAAKRENEVQPF